MDYTDISKLLAIGITIFYLSRVSDRSTKILGWILTISIALTLTNNSLFITLGVGAYLLTMVAAFVFILTGKLTIDDKLLILILLLPIAVYRLFVLLNIPLYEVLYYLLLVPIPIYVFLQLRKQSNAKALALTSIPIADCIITLVLIFV